MIIEIISFISIATLPYGHDPLFIIEQVPLLLSQRLAQVQEQPEAEVLLLGEVQLLIPLPAQLLHGEQTLEVPLPLDT